MLSLCLRVPHPDQKRPLEGRAEGNNLLSLPAAPPCFGAAQDTVDFLGCKHTLLPCVQFFVQLGHPSPSAHGCSQGALPACTHTWDCSDPSATRHLALSNVVIRFSWAQPTLQALWMASSYTVKKLWVQWPECYKDTLVSNLQNLQSERDVFPCLHFYTLHLWRITQKLKIEDIFKFLCLSLESWLYAVAQTVFLTFIIFDQTWMLSSRTSCRFSKTQPLEISINCFN